MFDELKDFIAKLSEYIDDNISLGITLECDRPNDSWPTSREQYRLSTRNYKTIYRGNAKQILSLTRDDFKGNASDEI